MSLLKVITKKSISGRTPKQPPNVATYTTGTQGLVPRITLCAPINPVGKGKAKSAEIIFFLFFSFCESESTTSLSTIKKSVSPISNEIAFGKSSGTIFSNGSADVKRLETIEKIKMKINFFVFNLIKRIKKGMF